MKATLKVVAHPETGAVFTPSKNDEKAAAGWGTVRIDAKQASMSNGILNVRNRTTFLRMQKDSFDFMGYKANQTVEGVVVRTLAFKPFYEGQEPVINPTSGEVTTINGKPYFQEFSYNPDSKAAADVFQIEEIVEALEEQEEGATLNTMKKK